MGLQVEWDVGELAGVGKHRGDSGGAVVEGWVRYGLSPCSVLGGIARLVKGSRGSSDVGELQWRGDCKGYTTWGNRVGTQGGRRWNMYWSIPSILTCFKELKTTKRLLKLRSYTRQLILTVASHEWDSTACRCGWLHCLDLGLSTFFLG